MGRLVTGSIILLLILGGASCTSSVPSPVQTVQHETIARPNLPLVAVLPHHDLVQIQRQNLLATLAERSQPETIILVAPNHFAAGQANIQTTDRVWSIKGDTVEISSNEQVITDLLHTNVVTLEDSSFSNEHGIKNILSDLYTNFPHSKIVPLILKDTVTAEEIKHLTTVLAESCLECGLIASVDMSHYNPAAVADIHDIKTLRALSALDAEGIWKTEVDSPPSLVLLLAWAKHNQVEQFVLTDHTNSGTIFGDADGETTTHILGYYTAGAIEPIPDQITFTIAGDMMYGRAVGALFQENNFRDLFANLGNRLFWGTDISWANLEGPVSDKFVQQDQNAENLVFLFSQQTTYALQYLKLTTVGLANNHTANAGTAGLETTRTVVEKAGIDWQGDPNQISEALSLDRYTQGDVTIAMISVHALIPTTGLTDLIAQEEQAGNFVMVLPHWGAEYGIVHSAGQEKLAREWMAAGADLIVGMHPHVVQDAQLIDGKLVIYSLGNFVFDQTFSAETQQGLIVTGAISADKLKLVLVPIVSRKIKPQLARGAEKQVLIDRICAELGESCKDGTITISL